MSRLKTNIRQGSLWSFEEAEEHTKKLIDMLRDYYHKSGKIDFIIIEPIKWPDGYAVTYFPTLEEIDFVTPAFDSATFVLAKGLEFDEMKMHTFQTMSLDTVKYLEVNGVKND